MAVFLSSTVVLYAQAECTRPVLQTAAISYIAARKAGNPGKTPLAPDAEFFENMSEVKKEQ